MSSLKGSVRYTQSYPEMSVILLVLFFLFLSSLSECFAHLLLLIQVLAINRLHKLLAYFPIVPDKAPYSSEPFSRRISDASLGNLI